ncbi:MAG: ribonuclease P protein component [Candidatus Zixiibacteriota bacterium]
MTIARSQSFPSYCRLKSPLVIRAVLHSPESRRKRFGAFRVVGSMAARDRRPAHLAGMPRFAFVVSRRAGPAHVRNRIRRRLRESVRTQRELWPAAMAVIYITDSGEAARVSFASLREQVRESLVWIGNQAHGRIATGSE